MCNPLPRFRILLFVLFACFSGTTLGLLAADPLTKQLEIDFGRDVASRNLKGLAARSDGRVLPGPVFTDLTGPKIADILWTLKPLGAERIAVKSQKGITDRTGSHRFLVGTGPDGKVFEITYQSKDSTYTSREVAAVGEAQVLAVAPLPDGSFLIGTSPSAAVYLVREGKTVSRVPLPADSVFDFLALPDGSVLASTGNPGKIYRLDPKQLAQAGIIEGKIGDDKVLADKGVALFGEIRDRNVRRLLHLADGRIIAGSSPKGNIYAFAAAGGTPALLQENRDAEVVDLLAADEGAFYAALVHAPGDSNRIIRPKTGTDDKDKDEAEARPSFNGRSTIQRFPAEAFPEPVMARSNIALYRIALRQGALLLAAGEQGDTFGYDPAARRTLIYAGSDSAELNDLAPLDENNFLVLRNNAPGLALLSFDPAEKRTLETKRLDLGTPATLGLIRFGQVRRIDPATLKLEARTNLGSDEVEGWSPWVELKPEDEAFSAAGLRGRYVKLRLTVPATAKDFDLDKATLSYQTQNRRPQLSDFRIFPPNLAVVAPPESPSRPTSSTLAQMLFPTQSPLKDDADEKRKSSLLGSPVIPQAGAQIIYWTVTDSDGDTLAYTLSLRPENGDTWTDLAVGIRDPYVQFDLRSFPEGTYLTRLNVQELAPRPEKERLTYTFETDYLTIDRTPPMILAATAEIRDNRLIITVDGQDKSSLLEGAEFILNNGVRSVVEHPADGMLDGKTERFIAEFPSPKAAGATSAEIILYDQSGNQTSRRLPLK